MCFCADNDGNGWNTKQPIGLDVPAGFRKDGMTSCGESREIGYRCARDECAAAFGRQSQAPPLVC
jgi:hypothetical protein